MSLAEELVADLEAIDELADKSDLIDENRLDVEQMETGDGQHRQEILSSSKKIESVAKLNKTGLFQETMKKIDFYTKHKKVPRSEIEGPLEQEPEYLLIVDANNLLVEIDNEIDVIHHFVSSIYRKRFPELEQLVQTPIDYLKTVKELSNNVEQAKNNEFLTSFLPAATIMIVSVSASTTQGVNLNDDELEQINQATLIAETLVDNKQKIMSYVESRMSFIAPNLSVIIGASTAAKLMGMAGGLNNLSKMPSCNVYLLGSRNKALGGFSTRTVKQHAGVIFYSKIVQDCPEEFRVQASRIVSSKVTLAARVDSSHESADGEIGRSLLSEIEKRLEKLQEPPPVKAIKPLPAPIDAPRKKRGGRRARKLKERLGMTEIRKQRNEIKFAEIEEDAYQEDLGVSYGNIGKSGSGRIRTAQVDSKTQVRITQKIQKHLQREKSQYGGTTTVHNRKQISGTASSVAFTPLQGLEIVNPSAADQDKTGIESQKYFSSSFGFRK